MTGPGGTGGGDATKDAVLFDPGLQPERTALAWLRTALAVAVGTLVASRVLAAEPGWASVVAMVAVLLTTTLLMAAFSRYRRLHRALVHDDDPARAPDGRLLALVAALPVLGGAGIGLLLLVAR